MYQIKRFATDAEARRSGVPGASGGDIVIVDENYKIVPDEYLYFPYEKSLAEARCETLNEQDVPDLFEDLDDG